MKQLKFILVFGISLFCKVGQAQSLQWVHSFGTSQSEEGVSVAVDNAGNYYITGSFEGTIDFDPSSSTFNVSSFGQIDVFVAKYGATGNFQWAFSLGSYQNNTGQNDRDDIATAIATDAAGNVYVTGVMDGAHTDFDPNGTQVLQIHNFLAKYNTNRSLEWVTEIGNYEFKASGIAVDNAGSLFVVGTDFVNSDDIQLFKVSASGTLVWEHSYSGTNRDFNGNAICFDNNNDFYITGTLDGGTENDFQITNGDMFIAKFDTSGNVQKAYGFDVAVGKGLAYYNNHIYVVGNGEGDFDPLPPVVTHNGKSFVAKYTTDLELVWVKMFGGDGTVGTGINVKDVAVDYQGNLFVSGDFRDSIDFNPLAAGGEIIATSRDNGFLASFTSDGSFRGVHNLASTQDVSVEDVEVNSSGEIFLIGSFSGIADFDLLSGATNVTSNGLKDVFLAKYGGAWVGIKNLNSPATEMKIFPNPINENISLEYELKEPAQITLQLTDVTGKVVRTFFTEKRNAGKQSETLSISDIAAGSYLLLLNTESGSAMVKVVKSN